MARAIILVLCFCLGFLAHEAAAFLWARIMSLMRDRVFAWIAGVAVACWLVGVLIHLALYGRILQPYLG